MAKEPMTAIRLVASPEANPQKAGRFTARLESTGELLVANTRQPLVDGARVLLARGFDPGTPLTMRHAGSAHDSFQLMPIAEWAKWTYKEREKGGLAIDRWMPFAVPRSGQKSGSEPLAGPDGQEQENRFHGGPAPGGQPQPATLLGRVA
jgi:hypothetical protein